MFLKQSTAVTIRMGPFLDATDGVTAETALSPVVEVSKAHSAFAARNSVTAITHDSEGWYSVELDATDTGTLGVLICKSDDTANHLPVWHTFAVIPANEFDSLVLGTDALDVEVASMAAEVVNASAVATDAVTEIRDGILDATLASHSVADSLAVHMKDSSAARLQKNTATTVVFHMVDSNGSALTGLSFSDKQYSLNGGAFSTISGSISEIGNGWYSCPIAASEINGDVVLFRFAAAGANDRGMVVYTQPQAG